MVVVETDQKHHAQNLHSSLDLEVFVLRFVAVLLPRICIDLGRNICVC